VTGVTFYRLRVLSRGYHSLKLIRVTLSVSTVAFRLLTNTQLLPLSSKFHHFFCEELNDFYLMELKLLQIIIFKAHMLSEFTSSKVFAANLTLNHDHGATLFDVFSKFRTSQSLEFLQVANIATVFEALIVLGMLLKITNSLPDSMCISIALMWKLTIINAISHDWIDFLQKVSLYLATRTANFMSSNNVPWAV